MSNKPAAELVAEHHTSDLRWYKCYYAQSYKSLHLGWSVATKAYRFFSKEQGNQ